MREKILSAFSLVPTCSPILHLPPYYLPLFFKFQGPPTSLQKCQETFYRSDM